MMIIGVVDSQSVFDHMLKFSQGRCTYYIKQRRVGIDSAFLCRLRVALVDVDAGTCKLKKWPLGDTLERFEV